MRCFSFKYGHIYICMKRSCRFTKERLWKNPGGFGDVFKFFWGHFWVFVFIPCVLYFQLSLTPLSAPAAEPAPPSLMLPRGFTVRMVLISWWVGSPPNTLLRIESTKVNLGSHPSREVCFSRSESPKDDIFHWAEASVPQPQWPQVSSLSLRDLQAWFEDVHPQTGQDERHPISWVDQSRWRNISDTIKRNERPQS